MATPPPVKPRANKAPTEKAPATKQRAATSGRSGKARSPRAGQSAVDGAVDRITGRLAGRRWVYGVVIAVVIIVIFLGVSWRPAKIYYRELRQATVARAQLREVRAHNEELRAEISSLETTAGIEEYARRSLGLVEEGDHTIVVYQNGKPISQTGEDVAVEINKSPAVKEPFGQWTRFLDRLLLGR